MLTQLYIQTSTSTRVDPEDEIVMTGFRREVEIVKWTKKIWDLTPNEKLCDSEKEDDEEEKEKEKEKPKNA
ncbi:hypothetical protein K435DRAFT_861782 [Dendrothele bispora CBS 962.96]|uniref:Uncharacterized protein n=1 Tax=Dendrothele bispora (strain CBS 962.96) TaxID=1314807 RepID=A0A4S8LVR8_DENBC|nr:hypothetical protein K435DRAFT_861782 [Dendrothele bispora CBS 962.96]